MSEPQLGVPGNAITAVTFHLQSHSCWPQILTMVEKASSSTTSICFMLNQFATEASLQCCAVFDSRSENSFSA